MPDIKNENAKKKVAIFGTTGMLGCAITEEFEQTGFDLIKITRDILDAQNCTKENISQIITGADYVINCVGIIKPYIHDDNSFEVQRAIEVNGLFPHKLAAAALDTGAKVIQIATDCVYDGARGKYAEDDEHNALDVYGKTKSLGEVKADNFLNLRCSIIGREKKSYLSLLEWFLNQPKDANLKGFKNHFWNGVTTNAFAKICAGVIKNDTSSFVEDIFKKGLIHVVAADAPSKAEMLNIFKSVFKREDIKIENINATISIDRTLSTKNQKQNEDLWKMAGYNEIPTVEKMIEELV